jgi:hypothetical protein
MARHVIDHISDVLRAPMTLDCGSLLAWELESSRVAIAVTQDQGRLRARHHKALYGK